MGYGYNIAFIKKAEKMLAIQKNMWYTKEKILVYNFEKEMMRIEMDNKIRAYEYLREEIVSGKLSSGMPIRELDIANQLGISRTPVREALRRLESEWAVISYPGRGSFVRSVSSEDVEEVYEMRIILEDWALQKSIHRIAEEELDEIQAKFETASEAKDWDAFNQADKAFHDLIVEKSGGRRVKDFLDSLSILSDRYRKYGRKFSGRLEESCKEHIGIIDAIRDRDLDRARQVLRTHLTTLKEKTVELSKYYL